MNINDIVEKYLKLKPISLDGTWTVNVNGDINLNYESPAVEADFTFLFYKDIDYFNYINIHRQVTPERSGYGSPLLHEIEKSFSELSNEFDKNTRIAFEISSFQPHTKDWLLKNNYTIKDGLYVKKF